MTDMPNRLWVRTGSTVGFGSPDSVNGPTHEYVFTDSVLDLLTWIEDNAPEGFWDSIPTELLNKVTVDR